MSFGTVQIQKLSGFCAAAAACTLVALSLAALPASAERAALIAKHVHTPVANGQVARIGDMAATQPMDIVLALPTRNQPELASC